MQEVGVRSLERAIGGIVRYKAVEWAGQADKQGLPPFSLPPTFPAVPEAEPSKALVRRSNDGNADYNPVVEADEPEKILGLSRYDGKDRECEPRRRVVWGLVVTGVGDLSQRFSFFVHISLFGDNNAVFLFKYRTCTSASVNEYHMSVTSQECGEAQLLKRSGVFWPCNASCPSLWGQPPWRSTRNPALADQCFSAISLSSPGGTQSC